MSTPHSTSPSGLPAVRIAFEMSDPESPPVTTFTFAPVCFSNASKIPSTGVKESYASSVTSPGVASAGTVVASPAVTVESAVPPGDPPHAASTTSAARRIGVLLMGVCLLRLGE